VFNNNNKDIDKYKIDLMPTTLLFDISSVGYIAHPYYEEFYDTINTIFVKASSN
jgi:hypothetical protein